MVTILNMVITNVLAMAIVYYSFYIGRDIAERHYPLINAARTYGLKK